MFQMLAGGTGDEHVTRPPPPEQDNSGSNHSSERESAAAESQPESCKVCRLFILKTNFSSRSHSESRKVCHLTIQFSRHTDLKRA